MDNGRILRLRSPHANHANHNHSRCHIHRLPVELVLSIFKIGADDFSAGEEHPANSTNSVASEKSSLDRFYDESFQVLASHVCARWRAIAFTAPMLWTTIYIYNTATPPFDALIAWLTRSQNNAIDVTVDADPHDGQSMPEAHLNQVITLLSPHTARLHYFDFRVASQCRLQKCLDILAARPLQPPLQLITLIVEVADIDTLAPVTFFDGNLPCLELVVLRGVGVAWDQRWLEGSPQLTDFEFTNHGMDMQPTWETFVRFLTGSPNLQILRIFGPASWLPQTGLEDMPLSSSLPTLHALQTLELASVQDDAINILTRLALPSLTSLTLNLWQEDFTDVILQLVTPPNTGPGTPLCPNSFLHGLRDLCITELHCSPHCVALLFRELRSIEQITLDVTSLNREFLEHISCQGDKSSWLPTLQKLRTIGVTGKTMCALLAIRRHHGYPLRAVYMEEGAVMELGDMERLRQDVDDFRLLSEDDILSYEAG
ncbi:hypothetical protein BJ138DRAFT_1066878 [Hygrophoropsis aurantiaca]|uniref:Uncharacterized protein n=1 Tax=Hygrophoropsis aurantiaca TaxID=72124 RepID=A0ACB8A8W9_9AGAM|nr:hypothetical protein BJ138DRAFT_1066878 [Hygrophoropsis aurantiaca]